MAEIPDVLPGGPVESDWGNIVRSRTLMRYASQGNLDVSIVSPDAGDFAYVTDEQAVKVWTGAAWIPVLLTSGGVMSGDLDMNDNTITGVVTLTGASANNLVIRPDAGLHLELRDQANVARFTLRNDGDVQIDDAAGAVVFEWDNAAQRFDYKGNPIIGMGDVNMQNLELGDAAQTNVRTLDIFRTTGAVVASARFAVTNDAGNLGAVLIRSTQDGGTTNMYFGQDGLEAQIVDDLTTATAANVNVDANGLIRRSTSAKKYKTDIKSLVTRDRREMLDVDLRPVSFKHKGEQTRHVGFIADEVADIDDRLAEYRNGEVENYDLRGVVAILAAQVNDLRARVATLEA